ncbi:MAG: ABC transporter permease, partial [Candidatus Competibacteraceae bacterium]|nr:ABC transporter permease [Candidatus Competibacteraceae bacterium]
MNSDQESASPPRRMQEFETVLEQSDRQVVEFEQQHRSLLQGLQHFLHGNPTAVPVIVLILGVIVFGLIAGDRFLSTFNMSLIIQQVSIIGILAAAQSLIVLTAGIDLSVAAIMVLASVVIGKFAVVVGVPAPLAILCGLVLGYLCGMLNGLLVTRIKLPPFIVTLGTWNIFFALNLWYSGAQS